MYTFHLPLPIVGSDTNRNNTLRVPLQVPPNCRRCDKPFHLFKHLSLIKRSRTRSLPRLLIRSSERITCLNCGNPTSARRTFCRVSSAWQYERATNVAPEAAVVSPSKTRWCKWPLRVSRKLSRLDKLHLSSTWWQSIEMQGTWSMRGCNVRINWPCRS